MFGLHEVILAQFYFFICKLWYHFQLKKDIFSTQSRRLRFSSCLLLFNQLRLESSMQQSVILMLLSFYLSYHTGFDPILFEVLQLCRSPQVKENLELGCCLFLFTSSCLRSNASCAAGTLHSSLHSSWILRSFFLQANFSLFLLVTLLLQVKLNLKCLSFLFTCTCLDLKDCKFLSLNTRSKSLVSFVLKSTYFTST